VIIGIGHDLCEIERVSKVIMGAAGERFMKRVLAAEERERAASLAGVRLHQYIAGRFAAKEAVVKALGCGIGSKVGFADIVIRADNFGKPICTLSDAAWARLGMDADDVYIHVTITHERALASAFAVVERWS